MTFHRGWFRRHLRGDDLKAEVSDEISFHIDELVAQYVQQGMTEADARRTALERFGDPQRVEGTMRTLARRRERAQHRGAFLTGLDRDLGFALRQAVRRPVFTTVALVTLAVGIGANTAIFSAVNAVLLRPLAARDLGRIVVLQDNMPRLGLFATRLDASETLALAERDDLFESVGGVQVGTPVMLASDEPQRLIRGRTLGPFFNVFGVATHLGRLYRPDESEGGNHLVAVLSYDFWRERGADSSVVGTSLSMNGETYEVVGVMQPDFRYPRAVQLWSPLPVTPETRENRSRLATTTVALLRAGTSMSALRPALDKFTAESRPNTTRADFYMTSQRFVSAFAGELEPALIVLLVAVGFVLLIACANIASLQLVHGATRTRELAVRSALGASRWSIVRQLVVENVSLALCGGVLGVFAGYIALQVVAALGAAQLPALQRVRIDLRVLAFTAGATLVCAVGVGLIPALRGGRVDLNEVLKAGTRQSYPGGGRLLKAAVVLQLALALVLVLGSTLMIRTFGELLSQDTGFRAEHVYTMRIAVTGPRARSPQITALYDDLVARLHTAHGITSAGLVSELPFSDATNSSPFRIRGRAAADTTGPALHANLRVVGGDYFHALGIPLVRGRFFNSADAKRSDPVTLIDETLAKTYFPGEDPIGKQINQGPDATIIGIVGSIRHGELGEPPKATFYYPYAQKDWYSSLFVTVRSALTEATVVNIVRREVKAVDPTIPVFEVRSLDARISASLAPRRLAMSVLTGLAFFALGLATFGMYGVISYAVAQRRMEFGIRIALGATPRDVRTMVIRQAIGMSAAGTAIGLIAAFFATEALSKLVFGVSPRDPASFAGAAVALVGVALFAAYVPARRATSTDPVATLRAD